MHLFTFISVTVLTIAKGFTLKGSPVPLVVPLGGSVVLPCSVDSSLPLKDLEVEWRRSDSQNLIHLYQDEDIRPEVQDENYHDRVHFFTENIKDGNFSLRINNLKAEDQGEFICKVFSGQQSDETSIQILVDRLIVSGSDELISASVGDDVTLNCSVDSHIKPEKIDISWKKRDKDKEILVLLYQNNETKSDLSADEYRDRVEFFIDEIHKGNFSLRLKRVRTEDKGLYICQAVTGKLSANTTVTLDRLGLSGLHIMVLILCITACGSALLFCSLIYCKTNTDSVHRLQMLLVLCPNLIMFLAFIFWGVSEGSVYESICCCSLYFLRPLTLLWAAPYINDFKEKMKKYVLSYSYVAEYFLLTAVVFSALFTNTWGKILNYAEFDKVFILILYVILFLCCTCKSIYILVAKIGNKTGTIIKIFDIVAFMTFDFLPMLKFILLFYTFGSARGGFIIIVAILPMILTTTNERMFYKCYYRFDWSEELISTVQLIVTLVMNALMIGFYIFTLENQIDPIGWACAIVFLQIFWAVVKFTDQDSFFDLDLDFHRFVFVYLFGSVGVVLISAVFLMTEMTLKIFNGERTLMDLRFVVFPSECLFILTVMISGLFASKIKARLQSCQGTAGSDEPPAAELHEMEHLHDTI